MPKPNGGPAFPWQVQYFAMTLRDYFAIHADLGEKTRKEISDMDDQILSDLSGVAQPEWMGLNTTEKLVARTEMEAAAIARLRGIHADAQLAERAKGGSDARCCSK